jgi:peptidoglycan hydrolase CwlO-like protein
MKARTRSLVPVLVLALVDGTLALTARGLTRGAVAAVLAPGTPTVRAVAVSQGQIDAAESRYRAIQAEIETKQRQLESIQQRSAEIADRVLEANAALEATRAKLTETQARLEQARRAYDERVALLEARAREAFMRGGAGSDLDFLLSSSSLADLSDRLEFVDRVTASDADIATQVENLKAQLSETARQLQRLQARQQGVYDDLRDQQLALQQQFDAQQSLIDDIKAKREEAAQTISKLKRERRQQLAAEVAAEFAATTASSASVPGGIFSTCPVGQPRAFGDDFGAPRYAGGFHLHMGNDILAPEGTPIYAPFDGVASESSNPLGGLSVNVRGAAGYVYNAHLSALGTLGPVHAGEVVGYVGDSGDAQGGPTHDHFEWHPDAVPQHWPASSYGYSVIDGAVNPHPLLERVC